MRFPSPLRAFGERITARRGSRIATVAVARKLVVLSWQLLTTKEDYAFGRPSPTHKKLRRLEPIAGSQRRRGGGRPRAGAATTLKQQTQQETELASQAETAYRRLMADRQQSATGAGATQGRASSKPSSGTQRGKATVPDPAL